MSQYNTISPLFKEFGFPVLEQLMKDKMPKASIPDDGVVEIIEAEKPAAVEVEVKVDGNQKV